jgi:molecular chaperone GrpE
MSDSMNDSKDSHKDASKPHKHAAHHAADHQSQKVAELTEALQRERADAVNLRRRHEEAMASLKGHVTAGVVRDLLPVIDNLERALKHVPKELADNEYVKGVQGVVKQFEKSLSDLGVERIKTVGEPFDPRYHEAISMEEGQGSQEVVSEELQAGYRLGDDIIRHAMVRVSVR